LKTADRGTWDKVFNKSREEVDHTILECLAYIQSSEIIINYLKLKLPANFGFFWHNSLYHQSNSIERTETLIANIFLSTLTRNTKHMLEDILNNFKKIIYHYR